MVLLSLKYYWTIGEVFSVAGCDTWLRELPHFTPSLNPLFLSSAFCFVVFHFFFFDRYQYSNTQTGVGAKTGVQQKVTKNIQAKA